MMKPFLDHFSSISLSIAMNMYMYVVKPMIFSLLQFETSEIWNKKADRKMKISKKLMILVSVHSLKRFHCKRYT